MSKIKIKRIYEASSNKDGYRILVDRIWPRGVSKGKAKIDCWKKEIAPSENLRKWFDHDPDRFWEFAKKYLIELEDKQEVLDEIARKAKKQNVTLLYSAKDTKHNHALVLQCVLEGRVSY